MDETDARDRLAIAFAGASRYVSPRPRFDTNACGKKVCGIRRDASTSSRDFLPNYPHARKSLLAIYDSMTHLVKSRYIRLQTFTNPEFRCVVLGSDPHPGTRYDFADDRSQRATALDLAYQRVSLLGWNRDQQPSASLRVEERQQVFVAYAI